MGGEDWASKKFTADVSEWVRQTTARMRAVVVEAYQDMTEDVLKPVAKGGRMRVKTGFLRASFRTTLNYSDLTLKENPNPKDGTFARDETATELALTKYEVGDTIYGVFGANYAIYREYGRLDENGSLVGGDNFLGAHTADWQGYVTRAAERVKASVETSK